MSEETIRLGVVGMGSANMASTLLLLAEVPDLRYRITTICGLGSDVMARRARDFGVPFWTTDYREVVGRDDVDAVCVFTPDALHAEHCVAALENGKHVVCTKPMVTRLDDARNLVDLVRRTKRKFLVGQTMRFDQQFIEARKLFDEGRLGGLIALGDWAGCQRACTELDARVLALDPGDHALVLGRIRGTQGRAWMHQRRLDRALPLLNHRSGGEPPWGSTVSRHRAGRTATRWNSPMS